MLFSLLFQACFPTLEDKNFSPLLNIIEPENDALFNAGEKITFDLEVSDPTDLSMDLFIRLESDIIGFLWEGRPDAQGELIFQTDALIPGEHIITVTVQDTGGLYVESSITLQINTLPFAPIVQILPTTADTTTPLTLSISAADGDPLEPVVVWYQNGVPAPFEEDENQIVIAPEATKNKWGKGPEN